MTGQRTISETQTALLVSNRLPEDPGGRAEKIKTRADLMAERGWRVVVGHAPEPYVSGFPGALRDIYSLTKREQPDLVISINNPFHLHLHAAILTQLTDTPWIAELRDPIASHPDREPTSPRTWGAHVTERLVVRQADQIVWHDGIQLPDDYFQTTYRDLDPGQVFKLPVMGYERDAFENATAVDYDQFTVTYAGSFYDGWIEPDTFLEGLGVYRDRGGEPLTAQFYGDWSERHQQVAEDAGVGEWAEARDFVPHHQIVPVLKGSDALLYVGGDDPENRLNLPSKLWDYVGARTPILAVVDSSFLAAEFVREHSLGVVVSPGDTAGVADAIQSLRAEETSYEPGDTAHFSREHSADVLAAVMDAVAAGHRPIRLNDERREDRQ
jgi:hypothetical protein